MIQRAAAAAAEGPSSLNSGWIRCPSPRRRSAKVLKEFLEGRNRDVSAIATCRRKQFGGNSRGSLKAELEVLKAAEAGCQIVDLEVESAEEAKAVLTGQVRAGLRAAGAALLVSFHDFTRTKKLEGLEQAAERIEAFEAGLCESGFNRPVAGRQPGRPAAHRDRSLSAHVVGIAMGEEGIVSRVLGPGPERRSPLPPSPTEPRPPPARWPRARCSTSTAWSKSTRQRASSAWPATLSPTRFRR
jgi:hypothetical protein